MAVSLFNGAVATVGSTCLLFFSQLIFFQKFAFMLCSTVMLSVLFSLIYYTALSHSFGPENLSGSIKKHTRLCLHDIKSQDSQSGSSSRKSEKKSSQQSQKNLQKERPKMRLKKEQQRVIELVSINGK